MLGEEVNVQALLLVSISEFDVVSLMLEMFVYYRVLFVCLCVCLFVVHILSVSCQLVASKDTS